MKLFKVYVIDDSEEYIELVVADCATAIEVEEIDGYKIILQPIDVKED